MAEPNPTFAKMKEFLFGLRKIPMDGELEPNLIEDVERALARLDFESSEPITLLLSSRGGSYDRTLQLCDLIGALNSPVDVVVYGDCCSMAVDLIQTCRRRMILPASRMLVHYIRHRQEWVGDDPDLLEVDITFFRKKIAMFRERRFELYERRTGLSREKLVEMFRHGETHRAYFSAEQAVEMKLADEILTDFKLFPDRQYEKK